MYKQKTKMFSEINVTVMHNFTLISIFTFKYINTMKLVSLTPVLLLSVYQVSKVGFGLNCSKLTTPLVNILLKFHTVISEMHQYF